MALAGKPKASVAELCAALGVVGASMMSAMRDATEGTLLSVARESALVGAKSVALRQLKWPNSSFEAQKMRKKNHGNSFPQKSRFCPRINGRRPTLFVHAGMVALAEASPPPATVEAMVDRWALLANASLQRTPEELCVNGVCILKARGVVDSGAYAPRSVVGAKGVGLRQLKLARFCGPKRKTMRARRH